MAAFVYTRVPQPPSSLSRQFSSKLCCLKHERRWQKRNDFLADFGGKVQTSWAVRTVLNHKAPIINGNGEIDPTRMLLEGLFAQQITKDQHPDLGLKLEKLEAELQKKEDDLQDAEKSVFSEHEEEFVLASSRQERLEEEMKMANLALASQLMFIEDLKLSLDKRESGILAAESALSQKGDAIERMKTDLAKSGEAATEESEFRSRVILLHEADEILQRQKDEVTELERAIRQKEEELEVAKTVQKSEQGQLLVAEANLKQQTIDWLMAREELQKLEVEISNHTLEGFERVRALLAEVRSELISSQKALSLSRQGLEEKERVLDKKLEELEMQRRSVKLYILTLEKAKVDVESERVKVGVTEAQTKEIRRALSVENELILELEKDLSKERSFLDQENDAILSLKKELDDRNSELVNMENDVRIKDAELVEARLEVQRLKSKNTSRLSLLANEEISELNESLREKEMGILALQRALTIKEHELEVVSRKLDSKDTELVKMKEEMSNGDLAIERLGIEAAQLEIEAVTNTLEKLAQMSRELVNTTAQSIEADVDISTLPCYESDRSMNSSLCIGESECVSEFRNEVAKLLALTEQLVIEADASSTTKNSNS